MADNWDLVQSVFVAQIAKDAPDQWTLLKSKLSKEQILKVSTVSQKIYDLTVSLSRFHCVYTKNLGKLLLSFYYIKETSFISSNEENKTFENLVANDHMEDSIKAYYEHHFHKNIDFVEFRDIFTEIKPPTEEDLEVNPELLKHDILELASLVTSISPSDVNKPHIKDLADCLSKVTDSKTVLAAITLSFVMALLIGVVTAMLRKVIESSKARKANVNANVNANVSDFNVNENKSE
jgi:hypothetical protein